MDDDFTSLEAELKKLRPAGASAGLRRSLEQQLLKPARPERKLVVRWAWLALPIAAAMVIAFTNFPRRGEQPPAAAAPSAAAFKPVGSENLLIEARDEGYVTLGDGTPARRVRQSYVDTITWKNPRTNASLKWSVPREEVRVVPVSFQ